MKIGTFALVQPLADFADIRRFGHLSESANVRHAGWTDATRRASASNRTCHFEKNSFLDICLAKNSSNAPTTIKIDPAYT
jgi:hypothetical protein